MLCVISMDWQYIAGFFDGEGCIFISSRKDICTYPSRHNKSYNCLHRMVRITLSQNDIEVLEKIQEFLTLNNIISSIYTNPNNIQHQLYISKHDSSLKFLENILPFVIVKKIKTLEAINFIQNTKWRW